MYTYWLNWVGGTKDILLCPSQGSLVWTKRPPFSNTQNPTPERASSMSPPSQVVLLLWISSTLARWRSGQVQIQEKTLWIWKQNTHQYQKNTNNHEDYDHQIITFSRSRIPTSSNRGTQQTLQPCPLRARADSFLCVVPALNCQCHWYSPPPPGEVAKIQKVTKNLEIHRYPSIPFPMVEHSMVAWKIAALHPNPWWILLPSSWTSPTLNGLLCVNNTTEQKLLLLLPWLKSVRAVRDQDVIIWLWQVLDSFAPCFVGPESWIFENCRSNTSSQCPQSVNPSLCPILHIKMSNQSNHVYFPAPIQAIQPIQKCHPCPLPLPGAPRQSLYSGVQVLLSWPPLGCRPAHPAADEPP